MLYREDEAQLHSQRAEWERYPFELFNRSNTFTFYLTAQLPYVQGCYIVRTKHSYTVRALSGRDIL
ncbi:hypothetical protein J6590_104509 [Homalodisca vitripennis]|nr:hypothetical protein J6590_104509 [Homalodisca vitripennis]